MRKTEFSFVVSTCLLVHKNGTTIYLFPFYKCGNYHDSVVGVPYLSICKHAVLGLIQFHHTNQNIIH